MKKGTIIAAVIFAALLVGALLSMGRKPERGMTRLSFDRLNKDGIDQIEITGPQPISVKKQPDGKWILADGKLAEMSSVNAVLNALPKLQSGDVVTSNPDRFASLEVDEVKGTHVKLLGGGKVLAEFVMGKMGGNAANVRSGDAVYAVPGVSTFLFSRPAAGWHHLKLFDDDKLEDVTRVEVAPRDSAPYALVKKDKDWELEGAKDLPEGFRFDRPAGAYVASTLVGLSAKDILPKDPGAATTKLDKDTDVIAFVGKDGARRELHLGAALPDKSVYLQVAGREDVFTLADSSAGWLRKHAVELRDYSLMELDKDKIRKLDLVDGKAELSLQKDGSTWKIAKSSEALPADFELDQAKVERRVGMVAKAKGIKVSTETAPAKTELDKPTGRVTTTLEDGKSATLEFGAATKDETRDVFYAKGNLDKQTYLATKWLRDDLLGMAPSLKKQPESAPNFDASQLANLPPEIRAQLMQQLAQKQARPRSANLPPPKPAPK